MLSTYRQALLQNLLQKILYQCFEAAMLSKMTIAYLSYTETTISLILPNSNCLLPSQLLS